MIGHNHIGKNGRFGNQMFQYAATRGIAHSHGIDFIIPDGPRTDDEFTDEEQQHKLFMAFDMEGAKNIGYLDAPYRQEASFRFDADLFENCDDNVNLYGYFQSEKWFAHIEDEIRQDFTFRDEVTEKCHADLDQVVGEGDFITLHVRRTDHLISLHTTQSCRSVIMKKHLDDCRRTSLWLYSRMIHRGHSDTHSLNLIVSLSLRVTTFTICASCQCPTITSSQTLHSLGGEHGLQDMIM